MSNHNGSNVQVAMRTRAHEVLEQALADASYLQRLQDNPEVDLEAAGFYGEFGLLETGGEMIDVALQGCIFTHCSQTCFITVILPTTEIP